MAEHMLNPLPLSSHAFDVAFHPDPRHMLMASCHVSSEIFLWRLDSTTPNEFIPAGCLKHHKKSCRTGQFLSSTTPFSYDPCLECRRRLLDFASGSADCHCCVTDVERGTVVWRTKKTTHDHHTDAVNALKALDPHIFVSGDDSGAIRIWDIRGDSQAPVASLQEHDEVIFALEYDAAFHPNHLVATCGDCLQVFDLRKSHGKQLEAMSDPQESDLLCCKIVRNGTKIVCGTTGMGALSFFSWGRFGDMNDRMVDGHGVSVDHLLAFSHPDNQNVDLLVTGAGDGLIRVVGVYPHQVLGCLGSHNDQEESIELLSLSPDFRWIVSGSHDNMLRFHSTSSLYNIRDRLLECNRSTATSMTDVECTSTPHPGIQPDSSDFFADL